MTELEIRQKYVNIIYQWYKQGIKEADGSHMTIVNLYNSHKPLAQGYTLKRTDSWCAATVSAAAIKAENETGLKYTSVIPLECSCPRQVALFQKLGTWQENDAYVPTIGDIIYYDWQDNGIGDNHGTPDHVGVVYSVSARYITVIEGNKSDAVGLRRIAINGKYIRGFGTPNFSKLAGNASNTTSSTTTNATTNSKYKAGDKYSLNNAPIFGSSNTSKVAAYRTGVVYLYDSQVINNRIRIVANAADAGKISKVIGWVTVSNLKSATATTAKPEFATGAQVSLNSVDLYATSVATKASSKISGTYYIWNATINRNRVRVTTAKSNVNKAGKITGWINFSDVKSQFR